MAKVRGHDMPTCHEVCLPLCRRHTFEEGKINTTSNHAAMAVAQQSL